MHRRTFLGGLAAAPVMSGAAAGIIDTHTHFYDPRRPQGVPWPAKNNRLLYRPTLPEHFRQITGPLGVTGTVVVEASGWLEDNQWVLDLAEQDKVIVGVVGHLDPGTPEFAANLGRFRRNRLFRGIRVGSTRIAAGMKEPAFVEDMRRLAAANLELDAIGSTAMYGDVLALVQRVPNLRIVLNHLPLDWPRGAEGSAAREAFAALKTHRQVYAKVSGVLRRAGDRTPADLGYYRAALDELWDNFGSRRLIYGSNWPVSDRLAAYSRALTVVREYFAAKGAAATANYFRKNSLDAYRWIRR
ncbi:MAG: amidohydrolase family protein [Bryobacteraceae bacterium]